MEVRLYVTLLQQRAVEYNNINIIIIIMTMIICTNPVRRRTKIVSISPSGVPFIGNVRHKIYIYDNKYKYKTNNKYIQIIKHLITK